MSYDLCFFRLAAGKTIEPLNRALETDRAQAQAREQRQRELAVLGGVPAEEDEPDIADLLAPGIDADYPAEPLRLGLQRYYVPTLLPHDELSPAALDFVEGRSDALPAELAEELEAVGQAEDGPGLLWVSFSIKRAEVAIRYAVACITGLAPLRLCVYDPQTDRVYDAACARHLVADGHKLIDHAIKLMEGLAPADES